MRKTTEELAMMAGLVYSTGRYMQGPPEEQLETFRRLVIENERECAEVVARVNADGFIVEQGDLCLSPGMSLHTFPPAAIDKVMEGK